MGATVRSLKSGSSVGNLFANNQTPIELLLIGGGGGGASPSTNGQYSGGNAGAAGGLIWKESYLTTLGAYTVTIGAGGAAQAVTSTEQNGAIGASSVFGPLTAFGGGAGPADGTTSGSIFGGGSEAGYTSLIPSQWNGGGGTLGQGNAFIPWAQQTSAGASGAGAWAPATKSVQGQYQGGYGGSGVGQFHTWLAATSLGVEAGGRRYIGGGGGGGFSLAYGDPYNRNNGGVGGGGYGGGTNAQGSTPTNAVANTGSGGGGGRVTGTNGQSTAGSNGGSGLCIVRYLAGTIVATGGTITTTGGYTYHAFTSSGTWTRTA